MDTFIEALPAIAQIGCFILISALKLVIDIGLSIFRGRALTTGINMALIAAELTNYVYSKGEDPLDEIKQVFDILSNTPTGKSSYKQPKKIKKHSGKKGDEGNHRSRPKPGTGTGSGASPSTPKPPKKKKCNVPPRQRTKVIASKILQLQSCDSNNNRVTEQYYFNTMAYHSTATEHLVTKTSAATASPDREGAKATNVWSKEHDKSWEEEKYREQDKCDRDEWPPAYFLELDGPEMLEGGQTKKGQRVRFLPSEDNRKAGNVWRGVCFHSALEELKDDLLEYQRMCQAAPILSTGQLPQGSGVRHVIEPVINIRPVFTFSEYQHSAAGNTPLRDDGLWENKCWPSGIAKTDPGWALLSIDEWHDKNPNAKKWDYKKPYDPPTNGDKP
ncbi:Hypothetical protein NCS54_00756000 [Fusarium falciforme]|uniref:Hypothetical protein n=1 Tax=Fusarium falciforme TaxID=195108 RepID=UPI0022FFEE6C|nr:Hypothetical protein NCS54_00756000 [Fusarium falciforme]WAO90147.1 Hypothetical protein NCS54_00756000 [Fusarium falciforme]